MNTAEDIRIRFMEKVVADLASQVNKAAFASAKRGSHLLQPLREAANLVAAMKYAYLDEASLADMPEQTRLREIGFEVIDALAALCPNERDKQVLLRFYRHLFGELQASFSRPAGLDGLATVEVGTVSTTSKHPKADNLLLCRVDVFGQRLEIVTNLLKTRPGQAMKVALVKPAEVMGILSEAQFLGPAAPGAAAGTRPELDEAERAELRKTMGAYLDA